MLLKIIQNKTNIPWFIRRRGRAGVAEFFGIVARLNIRHFRVLNIMEGGHSVAAEFEIEADGLLAVCLQHELDHLQGKVFVEYLSLLKRTRISQKLKKRAKELLGER